MITLMIFYKVQIKTGFVARHSKHLLGVALVHSPVAISGFSYFAQCSILLVFHILPTVPFSWFFIFCPMFHSPGFSYFAHCSILLVFHILPTVPFSWFFIFCPLFHSPGFSYFAQCSILLVFHILPNVPFSWFFIFCPMFHSPGFSLQKFSRTFAKS